LDFAQDTGARLLLALEGYVIDDDEAPITIRTVRAEPGQEDFLVVQVAYEVAGHSASITYTVDDWTEGALERSPGAVADGLAALIRAEVRERVDTDPPRGGA
jgi:hypothetical protein